MNTVIDLLGRYKYIAMFAVLLACGLGLPLPEEFTLISSGLAVGWEQADFFLASAVCVAGILAGDALIFGLGRTVGPRLLGSRFMKLVLPERRQKRVGKFFGKHGNKTVFFARFFAGLRIGVYFYAGQHGMKWWKFLIFDLMGALISGPTSIWVGKFAASQIADPHEARHFATHLLHKGQHWLYTGVGLLVVVMLIDALYNRRRDRLLANRRGSGKQPTVPVSAPVIAVPSLSVPAANTDDVRQQVVASAAVMPASEPRQSTPSPDAP
jgi:membrane protein DedA with SNARE-associated domain